MSTRRGRKIAETFDMVVLSVGIQIAQKTKDLAALLEIDLDRYGFAVSDAFSPLASTRPGIFVCGVVNGPKDIPETVIEASGAAQAASAGLAAARGTAVVTEALPEERIPTADEELRIGVFVCHCGTNIASVVDVAAVADYAMTLPGVVYAGHPLYTCSQDSQESIRSIIREHRLNRLVAAACSPSTHEPLFMSTLRQAGINKYFFDMANIRDQCSWVHPNEPELATEKSKRLVRMAVANASQAEPLAELEFDVNPALLVIGGGVAGMTAALEAAQQGFTVYLVEQQASLGGQAQFLGRTGDGRHFRQYLLDLKEQVLGNDRIKVFVSSAVVAQSGFVGSFSTDIMTPSGSIRTVQHGAIIVATGAEEARPELYGLGRLDRVITQTDFAARLDGEAVSETPHVVMLQCAGSRYDKNLQFSSPDTGTPCETPDQGLAGEGQLPYCSRVCCNQAVKNALHFKEQNPAARVDILYRDMRTYGLGELALPEGPPPGDQLHPLRSAGKSPGYQGGGGRHRDCRPRSVDRQTGLAQAGPAGPVDRHEAPRHRGIGLDAPGAAQQQRLFHRGPRQAAAGRSAERRAVHGRDGACPEGCLRDHRPGPGGGGPGGDPAVEEEPAAVRGGLQGRSDPLRGLSDLRAGLPLRGAVHQRRPHRRDQPGPLPGLRHLCGRMPGQGDHPRPLSGYQPQGQDTVVCRRRKYRKGAA